MVVAADGNHTQGDGFPQDAINKIAELVSAGYLLRNIAFAPDGHWLIVLANNAYYHNGVSSDLTTQWGSLAAAGFRIMDVEFAPNGGWAIVCENNGYYCRNVPQDAFNAIGAGESAGHTLKSVVFSPGGDWLIVFNHNYLTYGPGFPADVQQSINAAIKGGFTIDDVSFSPEGDWAVVVDNGFLFSGGASAALTAAEALAHGGHEVTRVAFGVVDVTQVEYPIQAERRDDLSGCGGHMDTSVTIDAQGHMNAVTHIWEDTALRGFHGGAVVVLVDGNNHPLWASPTEVLGVDGRWIGVSDRTVSWTATVPSNLLQLVRGIAIYQTWDPTNVAGVISQWLTQIQNDASAIASIVQSVATIIAAV